MLPLSRRLVNAKIDGETYALHVDLGATPSQLRSRSWDKAKLAVSDLQIVLVDEVGMPRDVKKQGVASTVELGGVTASEVSFVSYADRRWMDQDLEGTLGLSFFKRFSVMAIRVLHFSFEPALGNCQLGTAHALASLSCSAIGGSIPGQRSDRYP